MRTPSYNFFTVTIYSLLTLLIFSGTAYSASEHNLSGDYVYNGHNEKLVLSFKSNNVVHFRRYEGNYYNGMIKYNSWSAESIIAPYIFTAENKARALICQGGNPESVCWVTSFTTDANSLQWDQKKFTKSNADISEPNQQQLSSTFEELKQRYESKLSMLE